MQANTSRLTGVGFKPIGTFIERLEDRIAAEWEAGNKTGEYGSMRLGFQQLFGRWPVRTGGKEDAK